MYCKYIFCINFFINRVFIQYITQCSCHVDILLEVSRLSMIASYVKYLYIYIYIYKCLCVYNIQYTIVYICIVYMCIM